MSSIFNAIDLHSNSKTTISLDEYLEDIIICGDHAYIADHDTSTICIVDISNQSNFTFEGTYEYKSEDFCGLQVVGNYAYIAGGESGIEIFDVSDIKNPVFIRQVKIPAFSFDTYNKYSFSWAIKKERENICFKRYLYTKGNCACAYVLEIKENDLILVNEVKIPEHTDFKIQDGIMYYLSEE